MNPDGIQYLDFATHILGGIDWTVVNGYWSPLYPVILAVAVRLFHPTPANEVVLVHWVNFGIYLVAWAAFVGFWRKLAERHAGNLDELSFRLFGLAIFLTSALMCCGLELVTPDLLLLGLVFIAAQFVVSVSRCSVKLRTFAMLGAVLAIGYFAKAIMLPLGFVVLAAAAMATKNVAIGARGFLLGSLVLVAVSCVWIVPLSIERQEPDYGDVGGLAYAIYVNQVESLHPSVAQLPPGTHLQHPSRRLATSPAAYEFAEPFHTTYGYRYDAGYWLSGLKPKFNLRQQLSNLWLNLRESKHYVRPFYLWVIPLGAATLVFCFRTQAWNAVEWVTGTVLVVIATTALATYLLVLVQPRYIGVSVALCETAMVVVACQLAGILPQRVVSCLCLILILSAVGRFNCAIDYQRLQTNVYWETAVAAQKHGIKPGEPIANIGDSADCYWVRLAGARIIAEVPIGATRPDLEFWKASADVQQETIRKLKAAGAQHVIASEVPASAGPEWQRLKDGYAVYEGK
jgi:hypothetical protein